MSLSFLYSYNICRVVAAAIQHCSAGNIICQTCFICVNICHPYTGNSSENSHFLPYEEELINELYERISEIRSYDFRDSQSMWGVNQQCRVHSTPLPECYSVFLKAANWVAFSELMLITKRFHFCSIYF